MKSKKLTKLGRRKALKPQIDWVSGETQGATGEGNHIEPIFPDWDQALKSGDFAQLNLIEAKEELYEFTAAARGIGKGHANLAFILIQILAGNLSGDRAAEGVPPIRSWNDVAAILRAIGTAEAGVEMWAQAASVQRILEQFEFEGYEFEEPNGR